MEDTDSMAIVATQKGGSDGVQWRTSTAPQWETVQSRPSVGSRSARSSSALRASIHTTAEPYPDLFSRSKTATSIRRQENSARFGASRFPRSATLCSSRGKSNRRVLLRKGQNSDENQWSEHGLGHLLNPTDPESEDREWIAHVWQWIIEGCSAKHKAVPFAKLPAIGRLTVSSPALLNPLASLNATEGLCSTDQAVQLSRDVSCQRIRPPQRL